jgi:glucosamine-6-phosphate deaminase
VNTRVLASSEAVARAAADRLVAAVGKKPDLVLALPTGRTPVPFYDDLAFRCRRTPLGLARVRAFNLAELALPREDPCAFRAYMERHAWGRIGLDGTLCHIPNGGAPGLEAECRRYEEAIAAAGGLDLVFLGLGADGHVAYNLPGLVTLPTHVVRLPDGMAAALDVAPEHWPLRALTMGIGTIRAARSLVMMATGASKALAVRALVKGPEDPEWPASFLRGHPDFELLLDGPAASGQS